MMKKTISLILLTILGGLLGYYLGKFGLKSISNNFPTGNKYLLLMGIIPLYFFVIGIHEWGHALAGILMKFEFKMYILGPFQFEKENKKWKFKWNKNLNLAGGMVICLPKSNINLKRRFLTYIAGGPIASLILLLLTASIFVLIPNSGTSLFLIFIKQISAITALFSSMIFIVTSIPMRASGFYSDGGRFSRILRNSKTSEMEILFLKIMAQAHAGLRPKELDIRDLNTANTLAIELNDPFRVYLKSYLFQNAFDTGNMENAEKYLNLYLNEIELIPEAFRGSAWLDATIFYSSGKKDIIKAEENYSKFKPNSFIPKAQIFTAEALLANLNGNIDLANIRKKQAIIELPNMIDKGIAQVYSEILEGIQ